MKTQRIAGLSTLALAGALALTGCGSDDNATTTSSSTSTAVSGGSSSSATGGDSAAAAAGKAECFKGSLKAEGSSAQKLAFTEFSDKFSDACPDATVDYNPSGSGAGIKAFIGKQADFAGSDSALKTEAKDGKIEQVEADKACGSPAWNLPMVTGPIAIAYNVKGVDKLVLNADVAADIFNGKIVKWNDPAIAKLNAGKTLPAEDIKVFFRSDESGTTENFTKYLKAAAPARWTAEPGKKWTGKGEGKPKSDGVAGAVKSTEGGITYAEWGYAKQNSLGTAAIDTGAGPVELTGESAGKAVAAATQAGQGNNLALKLDYATKAPGAYPIVLVTYEIVCSKNADATKGTNIKNFLGYMASDESQAALADKGYAPLPAEVLTKVRTAISALS
ncbi:phosphate ABC transporter substrate-binding protein PstS [Arsenicicoccus dermatophilus]|uniref:phosphate ABC transporter substrate-binding protein PstS n=1 Tax=Arsenicicoccus dermatophilus TaxID=1076331 RepID=UPI001F4C87AE|nr:phosphate ABC transporter substrate-binding protein PstS [Arsenicicoccus dermatophilus]